MKNLLKAVLIFAVIISTIPYKAEAVTDTDKASVIMECSTGQVLYENKCHEKLPVASVTKLMCMLIWSELIESGKIALDDIVECTAHSAEMDGSVIWITAGEKLTVDELIKSVVIASANDACVALCEYVAGSEEAFVSLMNDRAKKLGMADTNYVNCVGYDDDRHYSSAYDIALLICELQKTDIYNEYYNTRLDYVREGEKTAQLLNTNKLINKYSGLIGGKTGTTDNAGCCFGAFAKRNDMTLAVVTLGNKTDEERFQRASFLLDYGFDNFEIYKAIADSEKLTAVNVENGVKKTVDVRVKRLSSFIIPKGTADRIQYNYSLAEKLTAPVECGEKAGVMNAVLDDEEIFKSDIVAVTEIDELNFIKALELIVKALFRF